MHGPFRLAKGRTKKSATCEKKNAKSQVSNTFFLFLAKLRVRVKEGSSFRDPPLVKRNFMGGAHHNIDIITVAMGETLSC